MDGNLNNDSTQPSEPVVNWNLTPSLSFATGARAPAEGEYLLLRNPAAIVIQGNINEGTTAGSGVTPISNASSPQHFVFIRTAARVTEGYEVEVYTQVSFSRSGGALHGYNLLSESQQAKLIPLPPLSFTHPTPALFEDPLVIGGWVNSKDAWLNITPAKFIVPPTKSFKRTIPPVYLSFSELNQIDNYRKALQTTSDIYGGKRLPRPPEELIHNPMTTLLDDYRSGTRRLVILEDVDEDAQDQDCSFKDELILLALTGPPWVEALDRFLQAEREEERKLQEQRLASLERWRHNVAP